jgi:hypothetical protein
MSDSAVVPSSLGSGFRSYRVRSEVGRMILEASECDLGGRGGGTACVVRVGSYSAMDGAAGSQSLISPDGGC